MYISLATLHLLEHHRWVPYHPWPVVGGEAAEGRGSALDKEVSCVAAACSNRGSSRRRRVQHAFQSGTWGSNGSGGHCFIPIWGRATCQLHSIFKTCRMNRWKVIIWFYITLLISVPVTWNIWQFMLRRW